MGRYTYPAQLSDDWNVPYEAIIDDLDLDTIGPNLH